MNKIIPALLSLLLVTTAKAQLTMVTFDASAEGSYNLLDWSTIREMNIGCITVERAADGQVYKAIGKVLPIGGFFTANNYRFTDSTPVMAANYYRLKITQQDGTASYSQVKMISLTGTMSISCFPNPTTEYIHIRISNAKAAAYRYSVLTMDGKAMQTGSISVNGPEQQLSLNVSTLPKGLLIVQLQNESNNSVQLFKIVKS